MEDIGENSGSNSEEQEGLLFITWTEDVWTMPEKRYNIRGLYKKLCPQKGMKKMRKH